MIAVSDQSQPSPAAMELTTKIFNYLSGPHDPPPTFKKDTNAYVVARLIDAKVGPLIDEAKIAMHVHLEWGHQDSADKLEKLLAEWAADRKESDDNKNLPQKA